MVKRVALGPGDCLFIPAYNFFHLQGFRQKIANHSTRHPNDSNFGGPKEFYSHNATSIEEANHEYFSTDIATAVSLRFEPNSELLRIFF
jgi:hypothetical protein